MRAPKRRPDPARTVFLIAAWLCLFLFQASLAESTDIGNAIQRETTARDRFYILEKNGCRFSVGMWAERSEGRRGESLSLDASGDCADRTMAVSIDAFREILTAVDKVEPNMRHVTGIGLPRIDELPPLLVRVALAANESASWKNQVAKKRSGAGVNKETAALVVEADAYKELNELLKEFGLGVQVDSAEKAFLSSVGEVMRRLRSGGAYATLAQLPPGLLIPGTAHIYFRLVPAHEQDMPHGVSIFGVYSDVQYIDEDGAGDLIGDEIHIINTGGTPYVVYLSFEGGAAVPVLARADIMGRLIEFSFSEEGSRTVTFRGQLEGCDLSGTFFYPHERQVKLHRESADCR